MSWVRALFFLWVLVSFPVQAETPETSLPNTVSLGTGWFEYFHHTTYRDDADIRLEHRWGLSLLSAATDFLAPIDPYFQLHPFVAFETTPRGNVYGGAGFILDFLLGPHIVVSPSIAVGGYSQGSGKRLGSVIEFRSTGEVGWRFDHGLRVTAYVSHLSNAELTHRNPGAEMLGGYVHIPFD